MRGRRE
jgi:trans-2,3-dihydro-3-hydroxyanthranilate isomerase